MLSTRTCTRLPPLQVLIRSRGYLSAYQLHYAAFNGCSAAAKTILKMHRGQIQAERFKKRDADAVRLGENQVELRRNEQQLTELRARIEELEEKEFELSSRIETLNHQMAQEDERFQAENDDLRYKQKQAEETLEVHAQQTEKLVLFLICVLALRCSVCMHCD